MTLFKVNAVVDAVMVGASAVNCACAPLHITLSNHLRRGSGREHELLLSPSAISLHIVMSADICCLLIFSPVERLSGPSERAMLQSGSWCSPPGRHTGSGSARCWASADCWRSASVLSRCSCRINPADARPHLHVSSCLPRIARRQPMYSLIIPVCICGNMFRQ